MDDVESKKKDTEEDVDTVRIELGRGAKGFAFVGLVLLAGIAALLAAPLLHGWLPEAPPRQATATTRDIVAATRPAPTVAPTKRAATPTKVTAPARATTTTAAPPRPAPQPAPANATATAGTVAGSTRAAAEAACVATCQGGPYSAECVACTRLIWGW